MSILKNLKKNVFLVVVIFAYIIMFILRPEMGIASIKESGYYLKEMLMIMPVIFILTALLDLWLPKEKVVQYLGYESGTKGIIFSFVLGSVSAGPVYAAFPMCVMLHKKGASVRNIVIILSSWAVIKIPMLLNETKFLGARFMAIRWMLTVIAIIIFSWITSKIVKDEDLPKDTPIKDGFFLNYNACMGCSMCVKEYPKLFEMEGKKARIKSDVTLDKEKLAKAVELCPVKAISYNEEI